MFSFDKNNIVAQQIEQHYKENYIANMLMRTLMSNTVTYTECCHIIELLKEKIQCVKESIEELDEAIQDLTHE